MVVTGFGIVETSDGICRERETDVDGGMPGKWKHPTPYKNLMHHAADPSIQGDEGLPWGEKNNLKAFKETKAQPLSTLHVFLPIDNSTKEDG